MDSLIQYIPKCFDIVLALKVSEIVCLLDEMSILDEIMDGTKGAVYVKTHTHTFGTPATPVPKRTVK